MEELELKCNSDSQDSIVFSTIINSFNQIGISSIESSNSTLILINEDQAKQIVEHFKEQFGWT